MQQLNALYATEHLGIPADRLALPERVLQFGTGVLLRGLVDYLIDKANRESQFNGRVVVVKSTGGDTSVFDRQNNLYTLHERGLENGAAVDRPVLIGAISRVLSAARDWQELLRFAASPDLTVIVSNTTEVGLQYVEEDIFDAPPASFPAKLCALLHERFRATGSAAGRLVIVPTELIPDNGAVLKNMVMRHAQRHNLPEPFFRWLEAHCSFCSSLVDRIVPGAPAPQERALMAERLGYADELSICGEPFLLWAVEGDEAVRGILSFSRTDPRMIIAPDITPYREQKLRILNGGHTISVCLAYLCGLRTVGEMMGHPLTGSFVERAIFEEIVPTLDFPTEAFARAVLDRFRNPFIRHFLLSITLQCTSKMNMRNGATFLRYHARSGQLPPLMTLGLAAYLRFTRPLALRDNRYYGVDEAGEHYPIQDDAAPFFHELWSGVDPADRTQVEQLTRRALASPWFDGRLAALHGLAETAADHLYEIFRVGAAEHLARFK